MTDFAELVAATNYSFLRGASDAGDMVGTAIELGYPGIGIADRNTVAGVVRAHVALKNAHEKRADEGLPDFDFKLIVGARLVFADGTPDIIAYPMTRKGWGRLTRLLTTGNLRAEKGGCILRFDDLLNYIEDSPTVLAPRCRVLQATRPTVSGWGRPSRIAETILANLRACTVLRELRAYP